MSNADAIAKVVSDLRHGNVGVTVPSAELFRALRGTVGGGPVVDVTPIYRTKVLPVRRYNLYEDHPCITPPWPRSLLAWENTHGNVYVASVLAVDGVPHADHRWETHEPIDWDSVRWTVDVVLWIGGRRGDGTKVQTAGPIYLWQFALGPQGEPLDLHWIDLYAEAHPEESAEMTREGVYENAQLAVLRSLSFLNCFTGETPILTRQGVVPIRSTVGHQVEVLTRDPHVRGSGRWEPAWVKEFGAQPVVELRLGRGRGQDKVIRTTAGHRWFIQRQGKRRTIEERTTVELRPGDRLVSVRPNSAAAITKESAVGVAHGLVFGDGSRNAHESSIAIYGDERADLLRFFPSPRVQARDDCLFVPGLPRSWKEPPREDEGPSYLTSFIAGWFAADGHVGTNGYPRLFSARREPLDWLRRVGLTRLGLIVSEPAGTERQGYGDTPRPLWCVTIDRASLPPWFFVRASQRARFEAVKIHAPPAWRVIDWTPTNDVEPVYCAIVPGTATFVLDGFILTGNCRNIEAAEPKRERHERRRLERAGVKVQVLVVHPVGRRGARPGGAVDAAAATALTSVRGHFAKYGPGWPDGDRGLLFGKHAGRFWHPQSSRGTPEVGVNVNDYELRPGVARSDERR